MKFNSSENIKRLYLINDISCYLKRNYERALIEIEQIVEKCFNWKWLKTLVSEKPTGNFKIQNERVSVFNKVTFLLNVQFTFV